MELEKRRRKLSSINNNPRYEAGRLNDELYNLALQSKFNNKNEFDFCEEIIIEIRQDLDFLNSISSNEIEEWAFIENKEEIEGNTDKKDFLKRHFKMRKEHQYALLKSTCEDTLRFFETRQNRVSHLKPKKGNPKKRKPISLPHQIALLNELGFFELDKIKHLPKEKVFELTAKLLNADQRGVKGNYAVLDPNSIQDSRRYTSVQYMEQVKKYINNL